MSLPLVDQGVAAPVLHRRAPSRLPQIVAGAAASATYALIVLGAVVRASGSGLGCPDWPLCHGGALPPPRADATIEFSHRALAAATSLLALAACVLAWRASADVRVRTAAVIAPVLLVVQIGLGAVAVALELPPGIVGVHLGAALLLLGLITFLAVRLHLDRAETAGPAVCSRQLALWSLGGAALVFVLAVSGALMRGSGASLACTGFPLCNGELVPAPLTHLSGLHLLHRALALVTAACLLVTWAQARRLQTSARGWAGAALLLVLVQGGIGATAVTVGLTAPVQVLHVAGAAAVWMATVGLVSSLLRPAWARRVGP